MDTSERLTVEIAVSERRQMARLVQVGQYADVEDFVEVASVVLLRQHVIRQPVPGGWVLMWLGRGTEQLSGVVTMAETEKITINMSPVDLGQIDLLVQEGFYTNRTDFIRTAIRSQLSQHSLVVQQAVVRQTAALGVVGYTKQDFERFQQRGEKLQIKVVGLLNLDDAITPELAQAVVQDIAVWGVWRASPEVKAALADRAAN